MKPARLRALRSFGLWMLLIFATSSTVVPFSAFVGFIQSLSPDRGFKGWFATFWLVNWFLVVKGWHATEFAILTLLGRRALLAGTGWTPRNCTTVAWSLAVLFAASDEWHQTFVPGRGGNLLDVGIDTAGATCAILWLVFAGRARKRKGATPDDPAVAEPGSDPRR